MAREYAPVEEESDLKMKVALQLSLTLSHTYRSFPLQFVDSHFHIWDLERRKAFPNHATDPTFPACPPEGTVLFRDYLMPELEECFARNNVEQAIFEQCLNNSPEEVRWVQEVAAASPKNYIAVSSADMLVAFLRNRGVLMYVGYF